MRRRRRVAVITGTRAEYGALRSTLAAIAAHPRLELQLLVGGMHLLPRFGRTIDAIAADGFPIAARIPMQRGDDARLDQAEGLARGVARVARALDRLRSDLVLVLGDRIEALAGALAAVTTGRVLAHVHGGDVASGDFDEGVRHAITKLAHLHLAASRAAAQRIVRMGEERARVHVVGAPGLDDLFALRGELRRDQPHWFRPGWRSGLALVVQHAYGRPAAHEQRGMTAILDAVRAAGLRRLIVQPNSDRGHRGVFAAIARHLRRSPPGEVETFPSLPRGDYLRRLFEADALVGNSSSGIIEAPAAGTPAVNVGDRQAGRQPGGPGVFHAAESRPAIAAALRAALRAGRSGRAAAAIYGRGGAGQRIAHILATTPLDPAITRKRLTY